MLRTAAVLLASADSTAALSTLLHAIGVRGPARALDADQRSAIGLASTLSEVHVAAGGALPHRRPGAGDRQRRRNAVHARRRRLRRRRTPASAVVRGARPRRARASLLS